MESTPPQLDTPQASSELNIEQIYPLYVQFIKELHEDERSTYEVLPIEKFSDWWQKIGHEAQVSFLANYTDGYAATLERTAARVAEMLEE